MANSNITLRQLRAFLAVAEQRSFSRAAERLMVSNPWVSETVKDLERQLGFQLFERTTRSVEVTEAGQIFAQLVGHVLEDLDSAVKSARRTAERKNFELTLGYTIGAGLEVVPWLLRSFAATYPDRRLKTVEFDFSDPTAGLRDSSVQAAIIRPPIGLTGLTMLELVSEERVVCLPEGHPLAARASVEVADVLEWPIIAAPESSGIWRDYWVLADYRTSPAEIVGEASTRDAELHMVARGLGISVTSAGAGRWYSRPGVVFRPIVDIPPCTVALAWWPEFTPVVADLVGIAKDFGSHVAGVAST
ncbi:LysR family transcriptional regulator [Arthrobacter sp. 2MCAF14]|uniref:LysR family transcriptional regulator n=1 Tax=Arthrobacter sp. 2MCAF14 TaxID=3232982 RepID=UPI003F923C23